MLNSTVASYNITVIGNRIPSTYLFHSNCNMNKFRGGIHLNENKISASNKIINAELPSKVVIPLHQHIGIPARPIVKIGDEVKKGQKIGEASGFISANIHASVSGKVVDIAKFLYPALGRSSIAITIESDGKDEWVNGIRPNIPELLSNEEIINIIAESGIVGMGGAAFPTHVKLSIPENKKIDTVILNGAECEPYITSDRALMVEEPEKIIDGLKIIAKVTNAKELFIGIEKNKPDAIKIMKELTKNSRIKVIPLKVKYPQGWENMLIKAILNKEVPSSKLPLDFGVLISNVGTAHAISNAVRYGIPLIERIVSISGQVKEAKNLRVRIGTLFSDLIRQCGSYSGQVVKVIAGGPMMGSSMSDIDVPVVKGTNNILLITDDQITDQEQKNCIRCGRCVNVCPVGLMPRNIALFAKKNMINLAEKYFPMDCKECGCCAYVCPAKIPLVQYIQFIKNRILAEQRNDSS